MTVHTLRSAGARLRAAALLVVLLNVVISGLPMVGAGAGGEAPSAAPSASPIAPVSSSPSASEAPLAAQQAAASLAPPVPMAPPAAATNGTPKNWTPYSPSAFTLGSVNLPYSTNAMAFVTLPNVTVNQTGNLIIGFNGSWNPAPAVQSDRDWVMLIVLRNGNLSIQVMESNTSFKFVVNASQLPFWCFFALPSPVLGVSPTSTAFVTAKDSGGNTTRFNLTMANAGLSAAAARAIQALPTQSVWFNASGFYTSAAPISAAVDFAVVLPTDGAQPFPAKAASVYNWIGAANFSGARLFLLKATPTSVGIGSVKVTVWTRGSPESGLNVNATLSPTAVYREDNVTAAGVLGNRSLINSTNWTVNTSPQAPPQRDSENCNAVVRTTSGQWRLFCAYSDSPGLGTVWGVDSAVSSDGVSWLWEAGSRLSLCGGSHVFTQLAIYRLLDGSLRMYFGGSWGLLTCTALGSGQVISSATSTDEGVTWSLEAEPIDVGQPSPDVRAVVPTPAGKLRMYFDSSNGMATAVSEDGLTWSDSTLITAPQAREVYLLTDGTYKMYYGTTSISSSTSRDGFNWSAAALVEIAAWGPNIEAGPLVDSGDGALNTVFYSQTGGLFRATLGGTPRAAAPIFTNGTLSDGRPFGVANFTTAANGSFERSFKVPADAPLGRIELVVGGWFGGPTVRSVVLNRMPAWTGPAVVNATEDVLLSLNLGNWSLDGDTIDVLNTTAASGYGVLNGSLFNLTYPNGVLSDIVFGNITDGNDTTPFNFSVNVTPVNDAPTLNVNASYVVDEDTLTTFDFAGMYADEETAAALLNLSTDAAGATVAGSNISFLFTLPGVFTITIGVSDGNTLVNRTTTFIVNPINDPPVLMLPPLYQGPEDSLITIDFGPIVVDEDNADGTLVLSTDLAGASVSGLNVSVLRNAPAVIPFNITVSDGFYNITRNTTLEVLPVDDAPLVSLDPLYTGDEDAVIVLNFTSAISDEDTPLGALNFSTNLSGTVTGFTVTVLHNRAMLIPFSVTVSDGKTSVTRNSFLQILEVNDPPVWNTVPTASGLVEDTFLIIDLQLHVSDEDNTTDTLVFSEDSPYAQTFGSELHLLYPDGVLSDTITLSVWDGTSNRSVVMNVTVQPVNDPPMIQGTPPTTLDDNGSILFQFDVTDVDSTGAFTFAVASNQSWITLSPTGALTIAPPPGTHGRFNYTVTVTDAQGLASFPRTFTVESATNGLPVMEPDFQHLSANATLGRTFSVEFNVTDPDGDPVTVAATWGDSNQNITLARLSATRWSFNWTPTYPPFQPQPFVAWLNGTLLLNDSFGVARYAFAIRVTDPPNHRPVISENLSVLTVREGQDTVIDLTNYGSDEDEFDTVDVLVWSFEFPSSGIFNWSFNASTRMLTLHFVDKGDVAGFVHLSDPSHETDTRTVSIHAVPQSDIPSGGGDFPWWLLLLVLIAGGVIGAVVFRRTRPASLGEPLARAEPSPARGAPPQTTVGEPRPVMATASRRKFLVEDLFLLYRDGRTIFTRSALNIDALDDPESVGAMLIAVQDFVKDSFRKGDPVDRMGYGDSVILLEKGDNVLLAVTVYGEPDREFRELLKDTVQRIEGTYAGNIEHWSGDRTDFVGIESILSPIWVLTADLTRGDVLLATTAREVQMLSGVEFFQGYVRIKVGIVNNTATVITGVTVDIDFNADVLRLHKIEPATYKTADSKVGVGVLHTGEKSTLAYYFDPQICTSSAIEGTCRYKDADGKQHVVQMKSRKADVVCPLFFTKEQANTAMLKRLLETEVKQFDVRAYSFREGAKDGELRDLFESLKSAVAVHDVQQVRSFEKRRPYSAEGWFYGKTQVKGYPVIVRVAVDQTKQRAEFFVASMAMRTITGLLAELHHTFQDATVTHLAGLSVKALFDENIRAEYASTSAASKMVEGEAASGDNEPM